MLESQPAFSKSRVELASGALRTMARAYGYDGSEQELISVFRTLTESWTDQPLSPLPWSGVGVDASPCDVSLVFGSARHEIRVTVEAQGDPPSPRSYWNAAMRLSETLEARYGADLSRLRAVQDLFLPLAPDAAGVLYHGAVFQKDKAPWFKVYLHLMCLGRAAARETAYAALRRLGLADVWPGVESRLQPGDELLFLGFDLVAARTSRVKLYIRHDEGSPASLGRACQLPGADHAGDVRHFVGELLGSDRSINRGALTSFHLEQGRDTPIHAATHIRLYPHCARTDADLFARLERVLRHFEIAPESYQAVIAAVASRPLDQEEAIHGWASIQWAGRNPVLTVYLSPRLHFDQYGPISLDPERMWPSPVYSTSDQSGTRCA
jgi:DMATS type aromatic prenyltransferase